MHPSSESRDPIVYYQQEKFHSNWFSQTTEHLTLTESVYVLMDWSYLMLLHTANASIIDDAAPQPLIRPDTNNVSSAMLQERLKLQQ